MTTPGTSTEYFHVIDKSTSPLSVQNDTSCVNDFMESDYETCDDANYNTVSLEDDIKNTVHIFVIQILQMNLPNAQCQILMQSIIEFISNIFNKLLSNCASREIFQYIGNKLQNF